MSYTIDVLERNSGWDWSLYEEGGTVFVIGGGATNLEEALSEAKRQALVRHRETGGAA